MVDRWPEGFNNGLLIMPMSITTPSPRVSFIVEWENALFSKAQRSVAMLQELRRQAAELVSKRATEAVGVTTASAFELLVVFNQGQFHEEDLVATLLNCAGEPDDILNWRLLPNSQGGYYRSKDLGVKQAIGELIIFLDSDVVPEPYWLEQILSPLEDHAIQLVSGSTYIETTGLNGKTFALAWFFPLRKEDGPLERVNSFFANNLAMRRSLYDQYPFPDLPGTSRGSCIVLASHLAEANVSMYQNPSARVGHPAPNGLKHFVLRALAQGRDRLHRERSFGTRWSASWPATVMRLLRNWGRSLWRICTKFNRVKLSPLMIPAAVAISWTYYLLYWVGEMMLHLGIHAIGKVRV